MSETISNLIAFVGFLIVLSMLVQTIQEALKNALKLKTAVWERFFVNLYRREFLPKETTDNKFTGIRQEFFWNRLGSKDFVGEFNERLQRLKGIVSKADEIIKTLKTTLSEIKNLDPDARDIQDSMLLKIKPLFDSLNEITGLKLGSLLNIYDQFNKEKIKNLCRYSEDFLNKNKSFADQIKTLRTREIKEFQDKCEALLQKIDEVEIILSKYKSQIENKIDAWIAQVNEEYRRNMLLWTFMIGCGLVLIFNADSFNIYKYISSDSKVQSALIQQVSETTVKTQKAKADSLNIIESALKQSDVQKAKAEIINLSENMKKDFTEFDDKTNTEKIKKLKEDTEKYFSKEQEGSRKLVFLKDKSGDLSRMYLELQKISINYQLGRVNSLDLPLGWPCDLGDIKDKNGNFSLDLILKKIGGLFLTSILITFGAPFWNDILGTLVGIKGMTLKRR
jgi:uncharacterized protein YukE/O6-methylguanine-DNA--protein-cysteine methyltransferase